MNTKTRIGILAFAGVALATAGVLFVPTGCTVLTNDALPDDAGPYEGGDAGDASEASCSSCVIQQCNGVEAVCLLDPSCPNAGKTCAPGGNTVNCPCGSDAGADGGPDTYGAYVADKGCEIAVTSGACASACFGGANGVPPPTAPPPPTPVCATSDAGTDDGGADAGDDAGDAGDAAAPVVVTVDGCRSCVSGHCGDPKKACGPGTECERFLECARACEPSDASCNDSCGSTYASGKEAARELADCTLTACKADCGL